MRARTLPAFILLAACALSARAGDDAGPDLREQMAKSRRTGVLEEPRRQVPDVDVISQRRKAELPPEPGHHNVLDGHDMPMPENLRAPAPAPVHVELNEEPPEPPARNREEPEAAGRRPAPRAERGEKRKGASFWDILKGDYGRNEDGSARSAEDDAAEQDGSTSGGRAMRGAGQTAQALKADGQRALAAVGPVSAGGAVAARPLPPRPPAPAASLPRPQWSASHPRTADDFALAAAPYRKAFERQGLKMRADAKGKPLVYNEEAGRPATPQETAALAARIESEPAALAREPSFFSDFPRLDFSELKARLTAREPAADAALKDLEVSADGRDVVWSRDCRKASGECSAAADASYHKGDPPSGAELNRAWSARSRDGAAPAGDDASRAVLAAARDSLIADALRSARRRAERAGIPVPRSEGASAVVVALALAAAVGLGWVLLRGRAR